MVMLSTRFVYSGIREVITVGMWAKWAHDESISWKNTYHFIPVCFHSHKGSSWHKSMNNTIWNGISVCQGISDQCWLQVSPGHYHCCFIHFQSWNNFFFQACIILWPFNCDKWKLERYLRVEHAKGTVNQCIPSSNTIIGHIAFDFHLR